MNLTGDLNHWAVALSNPPLHEFRIYGDNRAQIYAIVDEEDYLFFHRWCWCVKIARPAHKVYLRRAVGENANGMRLRTYSLYLHIEIMKRIEPQPEPGLIVDHKDSNSLNCLRSNLRWATHMQNRHNRFGSYLQQISLLDGATK